MKKDHVVIGVDRKTYEELDALRTTDKGKVSFADIIRFVMRNQK